MAMEVSHRDANLDRMEQDATFTGGFSPGVVKSFRKKMQSIRTAADERDIRAVKGNRFEKLQKPRDHQHSIRLNDQWRLILEIVGTGDTKRIEIVGIEDYH
jgi:proteic killer suppression protein